MVQHALADAQPLSAADAWRELGISLAVNGDYAAAKVRCLVPASMAAERRQPPDHHRAWGTQGPFA